MSNIGVPPKLPSIRLPNAPDLPRMTLSIPTGKIPSYKPLVVPPSDLQSPEGVEEEKSETKTEQPAPLKLDLPVVDISIPIPSPEVMVTAVTTAVAAVATTTLAQPLFDSIKKKSQKFIQGQVNKWKELNLKPKDSLES
tara:strand:- start:648 stop:1064 length:417 start_codon:yes stop_codon:yes gene_type:complete